MLSFASSLEETIRAELNVSIEVIIKGQEEDDDDDDDDEGDAV